MMLQREWLGVLSSSADHTLLLVACFVRSHAALIHQHMGNVKRNPTIEVTWTFDFVIVFKRSLLPF